MKIFFCLMFFNLLIFNINAKNFSSVWREPYVEFEVMIIDNYGNDIKTLQNEVDKTSIFFKNEIEKEIKYNIKKVFDGIVSNKPSPKDKIILFSRKKNLKFKDWSTKKIYDFFLSDIERFKKFFPEYKSWNNKSLKKNLNRSLEEEPVIYSKVDIIYLVMVKGYVVYMNSFNKSISTVLFFELYAEDPYELVNDPLMPTKKTLYEFDMDIKNFGTVEDIKDFVKEQFATIKKVVK